MYPQLGDDYSNLLETIRLFEEEKLRREKLKNLIDRTDIPSLLTIPGHPFNDLLIPKRHKIYEGGRGSAKSSTVAEYLLKKASKQDRLVLCTREYQNSILDSVHRLLRDTIDRFGWQDLFTITEKTIRSTITNSEFIFKGLHYNINEIRSMQGVTDCWVEEAQAVTEESWEALLPTIRAEDSEFIITFNAKEKSDATYRRFVVDKPDDSFHHHVNFDQNPFFPQVLENLRQTYLKKISNATSDEERMQAQSDYDHVWLGQCKTINNELVFAGKWLVEEFDSELYKKAHKVLFGADFGFSQDPSTIIRSFILDDCLYIEYEAWGVGVEFMGNLSGGRGELEQLYRSVPDSDKWPIKADGSRPETISFIRGLGFAISAADKWPGSVEDGIAHLRGFRKIIIHPRCKRTIDEAMNYRYKVDRITGDVLPIIIDKHNHCIAEGSMVTCARGDVEIENVTTRDKVLTRAGYKQVVYSGVTDTNRKVVKVVTTGGTVRCTPDHEIYVVEGDKFVRADELVVGDEILCFFEGGLIQIGSVLSVSDDGVCERVYDISVEDQHEFFADGILVSNCWDAIRYSLDQHIKRRGDLAIWGKLGK